MIMLCIWIVLAITTANADDNARLIERRFNTEVVPRLHTTFEVNADLLQGKLPFDPKNSEAVEISYKGGVAIAPEKDERKPKFQVVGKLDTHPLPQITGARPLCQIQVIDKNGTPVYRQLWFATLAMGTAQIGNIVLLSTLPPESTGWHTAGGFWRILDGFKKGPHVDSDPWYYNYLAHPVAGAEYYLLARNRDANWWQSLLYSAAMSTFWEFGPEAYFERPSVQDLIITPLAGAVLGEIRYQAKQALVDPATKKPKGVGKTLLVILLDPVDALTGGL